MHLFHKKKKKKKKILKNCETGRLKIWIEWRKIQEIVVVSVDGNKKFDIHFVYIHQQKEKQFFQMQCVCMYRVLSESRHVRFDIFFNNKTKIRININYFGIQWHSNLCVKKNRIFLVEKSKSLHTNVQVMNFSVKFLGLLVSQSTLTFIVDPIPLIGNNFFAVQHRIFESFHVQVHIQTNYNWLTYPYLFIYNLRDGMLFKTQYVPVPSKTASILIHTVILKVFVNSMELSSI